MQCQPLNGVCQIASDGSGYGNGDASKAPWDALRTTLLCSPPVPLVPLSQSMGNDLHSLHLTCRSSPLLSSPLLSSRLLSSPLLLRRNFSADGRDGVKITMPNGSGGLCSGLPRVSFLQISCDSTAGDGVIDSVTESQAIPCQYTVMYALEFATSPCHCADRVS